MALQAHFRHHDRLVVAVFRLVGNRLDEIVRQRLSVGSQRIEITQRCFFVLIRRIVRIAKIETGALDLHPGVRLS